MKFIKKSSGSLIVGLSVIFCFMACQAEQSKAQKQSSNKTVAVKNDSTGNNAGKASAKPAQSIIVYYFHGNARCPTCYKLESYAKSAVESDFADAIKKGRCEWKTVNVDETGNRHFTNDYKLYTKSVIVSTVKDGKEISWKNLDQIWQLVHEEGKYREYIRNEVKACLDGKCL